MNTWMDMNCRHALRAWNDTNRRAGFPDDDWDPRRAFAYATSNAIEMARIDGNVIDERFFSMMMPFARPWFPDNPDPSVAERIPATFPDDIPCDHRPLGLILTRETAGLLSNASASAGMYEQWRQKLGSEWTVYVDVPHSALTFNTGRPGGNVQIRAILAASWGKDLPAGHVQFAVQLTDMGTETSHGRVGGLLRVDERVSPSDHRSDTWADRSLQPPFAGRALQDRVLARAGTFLRLVLCYYHIGPANVREPVEATPSHRLKGGKPGKGKSLFALTRLRASEHVGRSLTGLASSWSLSERQEVAGHFRLQACGPQRSERRMIWIAGYERGPAGSAIRPKGVTV
ncbi:hypothetical protein PWR05_35205 [Paraburkholderia sp. A2RI-6]|uniref:hypothetical protein n=1 Tax=Paraburkholderia sp. A2RI-6 TaxID=3028371 RepID=UPI003B7FCB24